MPSRAQVASTTFPCPPRAPGANPHVQVGQNQNIEFGWASGHAAFSYWVLVHEKDAEQLKLHKAALIDDYLATAPAGTNEAIPGGPRQRMHRSVYGSTTTPTAFDYFQKELPSRDTLKFNYIDYKGPMAKTDPRYPGIYIYIYISHIPTLSPTNLASNILPLPPSPSPLFFPPLPPSTPSLLTGKQPYVPGVVGRLGNTMNPDRADLHLAADYPLPAGQEFNREYLWEYKDADLLNDRYVAYSNPKYPWILAAAKYAHVVTKSFDVDVAMLSVPNGNPAGNYIAHWLWNGYYDCVDISYTASPTPNPAPFGVKIATNGGKNHLKLFLILLLNHLKLLLFKHLKNFYCYLII